jgi:hypothetical protein
MKAYQTKTGKTQYMPSLVEVTEAIEGDNSTGFCLACGEEAYGVEPDARRYTCESCGAAKVYGAEELCIMGLVAE